MSTEKIVVKVGQIWEDCDCRLRGRRIEVKRVDDSYAYGCATAGYRRRETRILLRRMRPNSTGWRLIQDVAPLESGEKK